MLYILWNLQMLLRSSVLVLPRLYGPVIKKNNHTRKLQFLGSQERRPV